MVALLGGMVAHLEVMASLLEGIVAHLEGMVALLEGMEDTEAMGMARGYSGHRSYGGHGYGGYIRGYGGHGYHG